MNVLALYTAPERREIPRWLLAALIVVALHAGLLAAITFWRANHVAPGSPVPAVLVDLSPVSASPEQPVDNVAPGPTMQQADTPASEPEQPKIEETIAPTPPQQNPTVIAPPEQKVQPAPEQVKPKPTREVAKSKHSEKPPAPKTSAAPRAERQAPVQQAAVTGAAMAAAMADYGSILRAHLQRFKQYPEAARGATGTTTLSFTVSRSGHVLSSRLGRSSGQPALDAETLALLRRAQPLPAFPSDIKATSMSYNVPFNFVPPR
jgi:periplasmic protein TonB